MFNKLKSEPSPNRIIEGYGITTVYINNVPQEFADKQQAEKHINTVGLKLSDFEYIWANQ